MLDTRHFVRGSIVSVQHVRRTVLYGHNFICPTSFIYFLLMSYDVAYYFSPAK